MSCYIWLSWLKSFIEKILPVCSHLSWNIQNLFSPIQQCSFQISSRKKDSLISAKLSNHFFKFYVKENNVILRSHMSASMMTPLIMDDRAYNRAKSRAASYWFYWYVSQKNRFKPLKVEEIYVPRNIAWSFVASENFSRKVFCVAVSGVGLGAPQVNSPCNGTYISTSFLIKISAHWRMSKES